MPKLKKHTYAPNTVFLDMRNQPDAEKMLKIAKSIKGVKIDDMTTGQIITIHYPETRNRFHIQKIAQTVFCSVKAELTRFPSRKETIRNNGDNRTSETRLYHAMILK